MTTQELHIKQDRESFKLLHEILLSVKDEVYFHSDEGKECHKQICGAIDKIIVPYMIEQAEKL